MLPEENAKQFGSKRPAEIALVLFVFVKLATPRTQRVGRLKKVRFPGSILSYNHIDLWGKFNSCLFERREVF